MYATVDSSIYEYLKRVIFQYCYPVQKCNNKTCIFPLLLINLSVTYTKLNNQTILEIYSLNDQKIISIDGISVKVYRCVIVKLSAVKLLGIRMRYRQVISGGIVQLGFRAVLSFTSVINVMFVQMKSFTFMLTLSQLRNWQVFMESQTAMVR